MNPVYISILAGIVVQLLVAAYVYGKLAEKTANHASDIADLQKDSDVHWTVTNRQGERISKLEGARGA
jgi:hypothetical protein